MMTEGIFKNTTLVKGIKSNKDKLIRYMVDLDKESDCDHNN
jgi:hypothetical protein